MSAPSYFRSVSYTGSYVHADKAPDQDRLLAIAFTGRSNSGKSTLLSALCDHKNLAHTSKTAGKTRTLNYFLVPETAADPVPFYLVDMPGYGYAKLADSEKRRIRKLVGDFIEKAENLRLLVLVLDARRALADDERSIISYCNESGIPFLIARTKWDTMNTKEKRDAKSRWNDEGVAEFCVPVSSLKRVGLETLLMVIREAVQNA